MKKFGRWQFVAAVLAMQAAFVSAADLSTRKTFSIPAQPLAAALLSFSEQANIQVMTASSDLNNLTSTAISGEKSVQEALDSLLQNTGLKFHVVSEDAVSIEPIKKGASAAAPNQMTLAQNAGHAGTDRMKPEESGETGEKFQEVLVTGTHIHGSQPTGSALLVYSKEDIQRTGAATLEQFIAKLPQNVNTLSGFAAGANPQEVNTGAAVSINLRGLGIGTTLVLLNGKRLALASAARSPDISLIPLSAVRRVEVLPDGASAIYGSDAIGGVVNIILEDRLDGMRTSLSFGSVTRGGLREGHFDQAGGLEWNGGHALASVSVLSRSDLDGSERSFSKVATPYTLVPQDQRQSALISADQRLGDTHLSGEALFSKRKTKTDQRYFTVPVVSYGEEEQLFGNVSGRRTFGESLSVRLDGSFSSLRTAGKTHYYAPSTLPPSLSRNTASTADTTLTLDGELFELRGMPVLYSFGGGYSQDRYRIDRLAATLGRHTRYGFGELNIPLLSTVKLSLAGRYTNYSDFGSNTSPRFGLSWTPTEHFTVRGSYGQSFRAPSLSQLDSSRAIFGIWAPAAFGYPDIWSANNSSVMLYVQGAGNSSLAAEEADTYSVGFDVEVGAMPGLTLNATYFHVDYTDRIAQGDPTGGYASMNSPQAYGELFSTDRSVAYIDSIIRGARNYYNATTVDPNDPVAVASVVNVVLDNRIRNLSQLKVDGVDMGASYQFASRLGDVGLRLEGSYVFNYAEKITASAQPLSLLNAVLHPVDLRIRTAASLMRDAFAAQLNINYVDKYRNEFAPAGNRDIAGWTTADLNLSYTVGTLAAGLFKDTRLSFSVQNILDQNPPFVTMASATNQSISAPVGFDPVNASPLGRFMMMEISARW